MSCGLAVCHECCRKTPEGEDELWCDPCVSHAERRWPWALPTLTLSAAALAFAGIRPWLIQGNETKHSLIDGVGFAALVVLGWYSFLIARHRRARHVFVERDLPDSPTTARHRGGYRDAPPKRLLERNVMPPLSADETLLTALAALFGLGSLGVLQFGFLPLWLRFEVFVVALALVVGGTLSWVVYHGRAVADDAAAPPAPSDSAKSFAPHTALMGLLYLSVATGPGALGLIIVAIPVAIAFGLLWLVAIAVPLIYLLLYNVLGRGLVRVSARHRDKRGDLRASLVVGAVGAVVVALPLAALVGVLQWLVGLLFA